VNPLETRIETSVEADNGFKQARMTGGTAKPAAYSAAGFVIFGAE
jgi:hypothetical protein